MTDAGDQGIRELLRSANDRAGMEVVLHRCQEERHDARAIFLWPDHHLRYPLQEVNAHLFVLVQLAHHGVGTLQQAADHLLTLRALVQHGDQCTEGQGRLEQPGDEQLAHGLRPLHERAIRFSIAL